MIVERRKIKMISFNCLPHPLQVATLYKDSAETRDMPIFEVNMSPCQQLALFIIVVLTNRSNCRVINTPSGSTFKPSLKEFQLPNGDGNSNSSSNSVSTRFFHQQQPPTDFHSIYNPPSAGFSKFNSLFYPTPTLQQQPSHSFYTGNFGNYHRQIRVPGNIYITLHGRDAEIVCQFERYIILVQGIYWHHNVEPYGSYFDTRNGFGPHVTVTNVNPWKSILTIKDFNEDDYGPYRCLSTAVLPADTSPSASSSFYNYPTLRTNELEEAKRKVRFTREIKDSSTFSNPVYDPFFSNYLGFNFNSDFRPHHHVPQQSFMPNLNSNYYPGAGGGAAGFNGHHHHHARFPHPFLHIPGLNSLWSVHAPYFKPSYSLSTVYQEVNFAPIGSPTTLSPGK